MTEGPFSHRLQYEEYPAERPSKAQERKAVPKPPSQRQDRNAAPLLPVYCICCQCMKTFFGCIVRHRGCAHEGCDDCLKEQRPNLDENAHETYHSSLDDFLGDDGPYQLLFDEFLGYQGNGDFFPNDWE